MPSASVPTRRLELALGVLLTAWILAIYLPGLGRGFIRDDFAWIAESTVSSVAEAVRFFKPTAGFYRPMVSLSFAADRALFGLSPLPYALTNLLMYGACAVAVCLLARAFAVSRVGAIAAGGLWALNHHGINTTILWICGRTALLLALFATLAAVAFKRRRPVLTLLLTLLAMLSKEEAVLLPFVFTAWAIVERRTFVQGRTPAAEGLEPGPEPKAQSRKPVLLALAPFVALALYAWLHTGSGAVTPSSAPEGYRLAIVPARLARHAFEYLDRTCTLSALLLILTALVARVGLRALVVRRRLLLEMGTWVAGLYALTIFLPLRSGLYVLAPSVGVAILAGAWVGDILAALDARGLRRVAVTGVIVAMASLPIYWARNAPNVGRGELTTALLRQVVPVLRGAPTGGVVVVHDRRNGAATLEDSFGTLAPEAGRLFSGRSDVGVWVDPPTFDARIDGFQPPDPATVFAEFELDRGVVRRIR